MTKDATPAVVPAEKYRALCEKYEQLVHKLEDRRAEHSGVWQLARWAVRSSGSGLAVIREGSVAISNARWEELEGFDRPGSWRVVGVSPRTGAFRSLREAAMLESASLREGMRVLRLRRRGERVRIEMRLERIEDRAGNEIIALVHDVTTLAARERELSKARQELVRRERLRAIGELASGVAHDLNNTFNALLLRVKLVELAEPERVKEMLEPVSRIVIEAAATVARLQEFARRRRDVPSGTVELGGLVRETCGLAAPQLERASKTRIEVDVSQILPVRGTPGELRQMLLNLILNARDAMPDGGLIRVDGGRTKRGVVLRVSDEGSGIPAKYLKRIFDPFFTTKGERGTGLGLSTAYATMRRFGGRISAANRKSGGAVFTLRFPDAASVRTTNVPLPREDAGVAIARRILIVDDDVENLAALHDVLGHEGHAVETARSGTEAVNRIREGFVYDLVLCDLGMPEMDGWTVADRIAGLSPTTPVWLLTGWAKEVASERRRGVAGILGKPIDLARLRQVLASLRPERTRLPGDPVAQP